MSAMLLLKNGAVIDGTGSPQRRADVLISGERIVEIGEFETPSAFRGIDCTGLIVAPGFIDGHSHSVQGVTTEVVGNCDFQRIRVRPIAANRSGMPTESSAAPASGAGTQPVGTLALFGYE